MPKWSDPLETPRFSETHRPAILGTHGMAASGHYLATAAAFSVLARGGNAVDAGVAAGLCINVVQPDMTSLGGVAPIMIYQAAAQRVTTIDGLGTWPAAASTRWFREHSQGDMPVGILQSVVPAAADAWLTALEIAGTMRFADVAAPALELAEAGFPVYRYLYRNLLADLDKYRRWPSTARVFLRGDAPPPVGSLLVQQDLAGTLRRMLSAEAEAGGQGRTAGLRAARAEFYQGETAERVLRFVQEQGGLLAKTDFDGFRVRIEPAISTSYRGYQVYTCGPWCQGPVLLQALNIVEGFDLTACRHNDPDYLHVLLESLTLAFADREAYIGDPRFVDVPIEGLLSKEFAATRRRRFDPGRAAGKLPEPGDPYPFDSTARRRPVTAARDRVDARAAWHPDTSYLCVVDRWGNAISATPSDSCNSTPLVPGVGCIISSRGSQSWMTDGHPSALAPGKRPRLTPNPAMAFRDGKLFLAFGTPGGDTQPQAMLQAFANLVDFGMDLQTALERERASTRGFPSSWWPHAYSPGLTCLEPGFSDEVAARLTALGHRVQRLTPWERHNTSVSAIQVDAASGVLTGASDNRRVSYAVGW
jgi:gamma-glutamyltranspeptidase/glutathione hydrolase